MKMKSLLSSALAAVIAGAIIPATAEAQSVGGHSRGRGSKEQSSPPRTERRSDQGRQSQNRQRSEGQSRQRQEGRVSDQNRRRESEARQRQESDRRRREAQARVDDARRRQASEARERQQADQRREAQNRQRISEQNRQRQASDARRREAEARTRQVRERQAAEARSRQKADQRRHEAQSRSQQSRLENQRRRESEQRQSVGRITQERRSIELRNQQLAEQRRREADSRRADDIRRAEQMRREQNARDRRMQEEWERRNGRVITSPTRQSVSSLSGRDDRFDDWFRLGDLRIGRTVRRDDDWDDDWNDRWDDRWDDDRIVILQPRYKKAKKNSPPWWSNSRHNRDNFFVLQPQPVYYYDPYFDSRFDDPFFNDRFDDRFDNPYDRGVVYVDNDPWNTDESFWNPDPMESWQDAYDRRQQTKNEWRNIAYVAGAVLVYGLLNDDDTLTFAGGAGTLYALYRYEEDRKSQNTLKRLRAEYFSHPYFYRDGVRYDRRLVTRNGVQYYQFVRA